MRSFLIQSPLKIAPKTHLLKKPARISKKPALFAEKISPNSLFFHLVKPPNFAFTRKHRGANLGFFIFDLPFLPSGPRRLAPLDA
jgi:hypothetical protein